MHTLASSSLALALVATLASPALANPEGAGAAFDFGYVRGRTAVTDQSALAANGGRFGIRISTGAHFHFGAEVEQSWLDGETSLPGGLVARTSEPGTPQRYALGGNTLELKSYAGLHAMRGPLVFGGDAVLGLRDSWVSSDAGPDIAGEKKEPLLAVRARAEVFLTHSTALGAVASTDLLDRRNVSFALQLSLNFMR